MTALETLSPSGDRLICFGENPGKYHTGLDQLPFREIWAYDFEYNGHCDITEDDKNPDNGNHPIPVCLVAWELKSGRKIHMWQDEFGPAPPYPTDGSVLFVSYNANAEARCHLALGWPLPMRTLDLLVEFRARTNGRLDAPKAKDITTALTTYRLETIGAVKKKEMIARILRGGPFTHEERIDILKYCESDVKALARLLPVMLPGILSADLRCAVHRGRYSGNAVSRIERTGIPIDVPLFDLVKQNSEMLQDRMIADKGAEYGVFDGRTFKMSLFGEYLLREGYQWPRYPSKKHRELGSPKELGALDLREKTFERMSEEYPRVAALRTLRADLSVLRLLKLTIGADGRNRTSLMPFQARTGRNQPSNAKSIFGPSTAWRHLIKPEPGQYVAHLDYRTQEFAIAAFLSGDEIMQADYKSGDVYLAFGKDAGVADRQLCKTCMLATLYGQKAFGLARKIGKPPIFAEEWLRKHHEKYARFWAWSEAAEQYAKSRRRIPTTYGWIWHTSPLTKATSIRNFPMQGNAAEMLRWACILTTEAGVAVSMPIHDALLISGPVERMETNIALTRACMKKASEKVLRGFEVDTDVKTFVYPDRYRDTRGKVMWEYLMGLLRLDPLT